MKRTKLKKRRTRAEWTNEDWRHEAVEWAKKIVKHLAGYKCCKCGKSTEVHGLTMHGSHIKPESKFHRLSVVLKNIMCQCFTCHNLWHEDPTSEREWFDQTFPGRYEELMEMEKGFQKEYKYIKPDYHKIHDELKEQYNNLING